jgi:hypothetical protein
MKLFVLGMVVCAAIFVPAAHAQIEFPLQAEGKLTAFFVKELIPQDDGLPIIKVRPAQIIMKSGTFDREVMSPMVENLRASLLKRQYKLYRGPMKVGIYTYENLPDDKKLSKGDEYLKAIPVDKDAALQVLKEQDVNEAKFDQLLTRAKAEEVAALRMGRINKDPLILIPVSTKK